MEYLYEEAIRENGLKVSDLPEDAQFGISQIKEVEKAINMLEKSGKKPSDRVLKKIQTFDKWVYFEILDFIQGEDENEEKSKNEIRGEAEDIKQEISNENKVDKLGVAIDAELDKMFEKKRDWSIDEIKSVAKNTYKAIFDGYEIGEKNGVETTHYSFVEEDEFNFKISKK